VPAFNEESTVTGVIDELYAQVDELVIVDDGSTDGTRRAIEAWLPGRPAAQLVVFERNRGMSAAYYAAFCALRDRLRAGSLDADDLVFSIDADGQHDLAVLQRLAQLTLDERLDALLARRDMSYHGPLKRSGNAALSWWASRWSGIPFRDVESGYRVFRLGALAHALDYYRGYRYSETVEVAVVLGRLGYRVRNDVLVPIPVARSRTRMRDAVIDALAIPLAAVRTEIRLRRRQQWAR
jgi:glycosyltransferase involved in cell wall biosynthesis